MVREPREATLNGFLNLLTEGLPFHVVYLIDDRKDGLYGIDVECFYTKSKINYTLLIIEDAKRLALEHNGITFFVRTDENKYNDEAISYILEFTIHIA